MNSPSFKSMQWYTYILKCADDSYYVGHTNDVLQRVETHNAGQGSIHTKNRRPVKLVFSESYPSKAEAIVREKQIKKWSRAKKKALIEGDLDKLHLLSRRCSRQPE